MVHIMGLLFVLFGLFFVLFHSRLASFAVDLWDKMYPNTRVWKRGYSILFLGGGIVFIIFGLAAMLGIINVK
jgi:hypothetical protein